METPDNHPRQAMARKPMAKQQWLLRSHSFGLDPTFPPWGPPPRQHSRTSSVPKPKLMAIRPAHDL
eukprot:3890032-Rhodomonas_salina.2